MAEKQLDLIDYGLETGYLIRENGILTYNPDSTKTYKSFVDEYDQKWGKKSNNKRR